MQKLPTLKPGDTVEIIAPASRCNDKLLTDIQALLTSWQLNCIVNKDIFGDDLLCANTDEIRFQRLKEAFQNNESKAVICVRGGYGCMRLIPALTKIKSPISPKIFLGMSDITALNLYLQQHWKWPVIHGALAVDKFSPESIDAVKSVLFAKVSQVEFKGAPLNLPAKKNKVIESTVTGGNLCLVQTSMGTTWQIDARNKILFLEEIGERGYRVDRMLEHLRQANIFKEAAAILFGDFIEGNEPNGTSLITPVLERFAQNCEIPVIRIPGIGHGYTNFPIPLGTDAQLTLGKEIKLICSR